MAMLTRCKAASGIAVFAFGSFVAALGLTHTWSSAGTGSSGGLTSGNVMAQPQDKNVTDSEVITGPIKRPVVEGPGVDKLPRVPIEGVPPIKIPPIKEGSLRGNEGVGNGVDPDTPGHLHNGGNDDPGFSPGNPGATN